MTKLVQCDFMSHNSFQENFLFSTSSHHIHWPCSALRNHLCTPHSLLLLVYRYNHQTSALRWGCFVPRWSALSEVKASSPLLYLTKNVLMLEGCLCLLDSNSWGPLPSSYHGSSCLGDISVNVISYLTLEHCTPLLDWTSCFFQTQRQVCAFFPSIYCSTTS